MLFNFSNLRREDLFFFGVFAVGYSGAFGITNFHKDIFLYLRIISTIFIAAAFFFPSVYEGRSKISKAQNFKFMTVYAFFFLYALIWSFLWGGSIFFFEDIFRDILVLLSFVYGLAAFAIISALVDDENRWRLGIPPLSLFIILSVTLALVTGGITLSPLSLNFQSIEGSTDLYSQGFTKICAIAGVYFFAIATNGERRALWPYILPAIFFGLCILAGSRGDILAGIFALGFFLLRRPSAINVSIATVGFLIFTFIFRSGLGSGFTVTNRFRDLSEGDYSMRDLLFGQAVDTIWDSPCSIFGCGFNYFQIWNNHEFGLYPHNVFLESIITFGAIIGIVTVLLSIYGAFVLYLKIGKNPIFYIFLVDFFTLQKSSSLLDASTLPTLLCFAWFGGRALTGGYSRISAHSAHQPGR